MQVTTHPCTDGDSGVGYCRRADFRLGWGTAGGQQNLRTALYQNPECFAKVGFVLQVWACVFAYFGSDKCPQNLLLPMYRFRFVASFERSGLKQSSGASGFAG